MLSLTHGEPYITTYIYHLNIYMLGLHQLQTNYYRKVFIS